MKLIGNLKTEVEQASSKEEAKKIIEKAGILLTDNEIDEITGGLLSWSVTHKNYGICVCGRRGLKGYSCPNCGSLFK